MRSRHAAVRRSPRPAGALSIAQPLGTTRRCPRGRPPALTGLGVATEAAGTATTSPRVGQTGARLRSTRRSRTRRVRGASGALIAEMRAEGEARAGSGDVVPEALGARRGRSSWAAAPAPWWAAPVTPPEDRA